jgi:predicted nucleic acid-binding protein
LPKQSATQVFFDSDTVIAGSASTQGASIILMQLSELGLIQGFTSQKVIDECRKNLQIKLPDALPQFEKIIPHALRVVKNPLQEQTVEYTQMADKKDLSILTAAIRINAQFLITFNTKDFYPDPAVGLSVMEPGELLKRIRFKLGQLAEE